MIFEAPKRQVKKVFLHCSASELNVSGNALVTTIHNWHVRDRGWSDIGYHLLIDKLGEVLEGRPLEKTPAAQKGHNTGSIAIMVHGLEDFSDVSLTALSDLCKQINEAYSGLVSFHGHCEVSNKTCPVFSYKELLNLDRFGRMP